MSGMISDTYSSAPPIAMGDRGGNISSPWSPYDTEDAGQRPAHPGKGASYPILGHLTILRMRARGPRTLAKVHHIQSSVALRYTDEGLCVRCFIQFSKCSEPEHVEKLSRPYIFHIRSLRLSMRHLSWPTITNGKREVVCHDVCRRLCARYQSICPIYAHQA